MQLTYESIGIPPEFLHDGTACWNGPKGVVQQVRSYLPFEVDPRVVRHTMQRTWEAWAAGGIDHFDAGDMDGKAGRGIKRRLSDDEIQMALRFARDDGLDMALAMVNDLRKKKRTEGHDGNPPDPSKTPVVWSTVQAAVKSWGAVCHKRQTRKTGSRDPYSLWAVFRHQFAKQLQEQFSDIPDADRTEGWYAIRCPATCCNFLENKPPCVLHRPRLDPCQVLFVDEHHEKIKIGKGAALPKTRGRGL